MTWLIGIWIVWVIAIIGNYLLWLCTKWSYGLVIFPFFMVLSTLIFLWRHRVRRRKVYFFDQVSRLKRRQLINCYAIAFSLRIQLFTSAIESMQLKIFVVSIIGSAKMDLIIQTSISRSPLTPMQV